MTYLDTHIAAWLHDAEVAHLSAPARKMIEGEDLRISPIVVLELKFLHEIGRIRATDREIVKSLAGAIGVEVCAMPFSVVVDFASLETWTRDPFDRLIVGQAKAADAYLVTKDARIRRHYRKAVW